MGNGLSESVDRVGPVAGFIQPTQDQSEEIEGKVYEAWRAYCVDTLGRSDSFARNAGDRSLQRRRGQGVVRQLRKQGIDLGGVRALDVGSGLGDVSLELAAAGAQVTGLEPCEAWRRVAGERAEQAGVSVRYVDGDACRLPFEDGSFDVCVCMQVLEHVKDPRAAVREIARVLRPGGTFLVTCENYLAFREQHYGVAWVPALPRWAGRLYLKLRGRDTAFFDDHITFIYWHRLARWFLESGLIDAGWVELLERQEKGALGKREKLVYAPFRFLCGTSTARVALVCRQNWTQLFGVGFRACGRKQGPSDSL